MATALLTPPAARPITLAEVKTHLRIETSDDDSYLDGLIDIAIAHLQAVSGLKLITQTWRQFADDMPPGGRFRLAVGPVQSIAALRYFDEAGNAVEIAADMMELDAVSVPARLQVDAAMLPGRKLNGIEIEIVVGFGDTANDVPDNLRRALMLLIAHAYEFRGAVPLEETPASEPHGFRTLIAPFKRVQLC